MMQIILTITSTSVVPVLRQRWGNAKGGFMGAGRAGSVEHAHGELQPHSWHGESKGGLGGGNKHTAQHSTQHAQQPWSIAEAFWITNPSFEACTRGEAIKCLREHCRSFKKQLQPSQAGQPGPEAASPPMTPRGKPGKPCKHVLHTMDLSNKQIIA